MNIGLNNDSQIFVQIELLQEFFRQKHSFVCQNLIFLRKAKCALL